MTVGRKFHYEFYGFRLDVEDQQLLKNGAPVQLSPKTFQVLEILVSRSGQTVRKEEIFDRLWPDNFVEEGNLTQHIHVLRKTLGRKPDEQSFIETLPKQGYRFTLQPHEIDLVEDVSPNGPLDRAQNAEAAANGQRASPFVGSAPDHFKKNESGELDQTANDPPHEGPDDSTASNHSGRPRFRTLTISGFLLFGFVAALSIFYYFRPARQPNPPAKSRSIAVLPFKSIGDRLDREKLGLGLADAVIMQLSKLPQLEVRPTSAIYPYVDQPELDSVELGRRLEVDVVLEGTIQREDDRTKVSIQLLKVPEGTTILAESYYESASDIFVVQDAISKRIVSTLSPRLASSDRSYLSLSTIADSRASAIPTF